MPDIQLVPSCGVSLLVGRYQFILPADRPVYEQLAKGCYPRRWRFSVSVVPHDMFVCLFVCLFICTISQVSAASDRPSRRSASRPPCFTQMSTVSVINWWPTTVTSLPHWLYTYVDSIWDSQPFQRYDWCPPKFKCFTWPNHAHFRDFFHSEILLEDFRI